MNNIIGVKELRENFGTYEKLVSTGRSFVVMKRSRPIFTINPINEDGWEMMIDFTKFRKGGIPASELLAKLKKL